MLKLIQRTFLENPVQFLSPRVSVLKRGNVAPEITISNEGKLLKLSPSQSKPLADALMEVAQALENALGIHQGIQGLNLSLDQYRPLAETLMSTSSSIDAVLGESL